VDTAPAPTAPTFPTLAQSTCRLPTGMPSTLRRFVNEVSRLMDTPRLWIRSADEPSPRLAPARRVRAARREWQANAECEKPGQAIAAGTHRVGSRTNRCAGGPVTPRRVVVPQQAVRKGRSGRAGDGGGRLVPPSAGGMHRC